MKKFKFEIQEVYDPDTQAQYRVLVINGEVFDWGVNDSDLANAKKLCGNDPFFKKSIQGDICRFFLNCLSEVLETEVTLGQVNEALKQGYLEC